MIVDAQTLIHNAAVTATAGSTDVLDLGVDRGIGTGETLSVIVAIGAVTGTSPTLTIAINQDGSNPPTTTTMTSRQFTATDANTIQVLDIPAGAVGRYLDLQFTAGGTTPSFGIKAWVAPGNFAQLFRAFASGYTVA